MSEQLWHRNDDELLATLADVEARMRRDYGRMLELLGELQARNVCEVKGYRAMPHLVSDVLLISRKEANRRLTHAAAVTPVHAISGQELPPPLPACAQAMRQGALAAEHLDAIHRTMAQLPPTVESEDRLEAEKILADAAHSLDPNAIAALGRSIRERLDQDGSPPTDTELLYPLNELRCSRRTNGRIKLNGELGVEGAALLATVLGPLAKPKPAADGVPDARSQAERLGDALVEALRLAANCDDLPAEGGERPNVVVTMSLDALRAEVGPTLLDGAGPIDARIARRLACDSNVIPAVLGSRGEPMDIGRKTRTVPAPMRRAVVLRDGGCAFPGCSAPARWCQAHHITHWADGGDTAVHNLVLLCGFHHRLLHHSDWEVALVDDIPAFYPPPFVDPERRPRRNPLHPSVA